MLSAAVIWLIAFNFCCTIATADDPSLVRTNSGLVSGKLIELEPGVEVYQYSGIPYATPPIGNLRFKKPKPVEPWGDAVLNATGSPNACMQILYNKRSDVSGFFNLTNFALSEDCLFLNIWVPKATIDALNQESDFEPLSVFSLIIPGQFAYGSVNNYYASGLAAYNNIIVAAIQYRLGSLGFLYFGTEDAPGNMGLWDQLEALKWLHKNIDAFGGNKEEITLAGLSSGGASVHAHILSPYSRNFFSRAIVESASALSPWLVSSAATGRAIAEVIYQTLGPKLCNATGLLPTAPTIDQKLACLQAIPADLFPQADNMPFALGYGVSLLPVVDGIFIPKNPIDLLMAGNFSQVPLLIGASKDEGSIYVQVTPLGSKILPTTDNPNQASVDNLTFKDYFALNIDLLKSLGGPYLRSVPQIVDLITYQYWPRNHEGYPQGAEIAKVVTEIITDSALLCPTYAWAQLASKFSQVYTFYFTYRRAGAVSPAWMGVTHGSLQPFALGEPFFIGTERFNYNCEDDDLSRVIMAYYSNFVKYGNPNGKSSSDLEVPYSDLVLRPWPLYNNEQCPATYFEINYDTVVEQSREALICGLKTWNCMFWGDFIPKLATVRP